MAFLREIAVERLFDLYDHTLELRADPPVTFVAGPNGIGKTTLLRLTHAMLTASYDELPKHRFVRLSASSDTSTISIEPEDADDEAAGSQLLLRLRQKGRRVKEARLDLRMRRLPRLPSWLEPIGPDLWRDMRTGRIMETEEIERRYPLGARRPRRPVQPPEWFEQEEWSTDFIETKRLDSLLMRGRESAPDQPGDRAPIHFYLDSVTSAMRDARISSARISQLRDRSFARRMLEKGGPRFVNEEALRERYSEAEETAAELERNGLLAESLDFLPARKLTPTEKRVMRLFLDDFEAKAAPLEATSARVRQLRDIVGSKFLNKHVTFDLQKGPVFIVEPDGVPIDADALSSGEQHELALVSRLLFSVPQGTTVLIDEPELSLHVTWQHRMLGDLTRIAELVGLRFVLATHSTAIINGRWDLVEELGPIDDSPRTQDIA